eukprot:359480-Chlamydomonas_euryale.AAC.1
MEGWEDGCIGKWMGDGWMDECIYGWMGRQAGGPTGGWIDGRAGGKCGRRDRRRGHMDLASAPHTWIWRLHRTHGFGVCTGTGSHSPTLLLHVCLRACSILHVVGQWHDCCIWLFHVVPGWPPDWSSLRGFALYLQTILCFPFPSSHTLLRPFPSDHVWLCPVL